jgi:hypothetical protein
VPTDYATDHPDSAKMFRALEPLHSMIYFVPEADEQYVRAGLETGRMGYFASRSAPMGAVTAAVTAATFYNFNPALVAHHMAGAWQLATPAALIEARFRAVDLALRRVLGDRINSPEVLEALELARDATLALKPGGRALFAGLTDLDWPEQPHLALWHAVTLLREYRGDGHIIALVDAALSNVESIMTYTATGRGFVESAAKTSRGWSDEEWDIAADGLRSRGILEPNSVALTATGTALRDRVEAQTDRLASAPWDRLGPARTERLRQLAKTFSWALVDAKTFDVPIFATARTPEDPAERTA